MDETSLAYHFGNLQGTVLKRARGKCAAADNASLAETRGHVSLLATVACDQSVQEILPQVILGNQHKFTRGTLAEVAGVCPRNVHLWREASAWSSHATMRRYIALLSKCLGRWMEQRTVILLVDCAQVHIHASIYRLAKQKGLRLCYAPAKMTRWLQPCDTHVFSQFKRILKDKWRTCKSEAASGLVGAGLWLRVIFSTIKDVLDMKDWKAAFLKCGILDRQQGVSPQLCQALQVDALPIVPTDPPSLAEATVMFPRRMKIDVLSYVLWVPASQRKKGLFEKRHAPSASSSTALPRRKLPATFQGRIVRTLD